MKSLRNTEALLAAALFVVASAVNVFAQENDDKQRDRTKNETTLSGCLNRDTAGTYTLTDETSGDKTAITGPTELEKHSANHKVTLTGTMKTDSDGKKVFEVTKIQHVSTSCKLPAQ